MAYLKQRGNTFYAVWKKNGKKIVTNTGIKGTSAKNRNEAWKRAQIMESVAKGRISVEQGVDAVIAAAEAAGIAEKKPTIAEFYANFEKTHFIGKDPGNFRTALKRFLSFLGEGALLPMDKLSSEKCREFLAREMLRVRPNTVHEYRVRLNTAYREAWQDGVIRRNPWATAKTKRTQGVERKRFSRSEMQYIFSNLTYPWKQIVTLDIMTSGQRIGDIVNMRWDQVDMKNRMIRLRTKKTNNFLELPLTKYGMTVLKELHGITGNNEYLFPIMHSRYERSKGCLSTEFVNMLNALGFETHLDEKLEGNRRRVAVRCFHSFRHTVVSELQNNPKYTATYAEKLVGQSAPVSRAYHALLEEEKLSGIEFLETVLAEKNTPPTETP